MPENQLSNIEKLPKPNFEGPMASVFSNPFIEAENAKRAVLEQHVKMVPTKNDLTTINGKKICWNYRKGRCRFGHKCAFAHDSDLQKSEEELQKEKEINLKDTVICQSNVNQDKISDELKNKKKRPGLTQGLVPGKKVMKLFNKQQNKSLC